MENKDLTSSTESILIEMGFPKNVAKKSFAEYPNSLEDAILYAMGEKKDIGEVVVKKSKLNDPKSSKSSHSSHSEKQFTWNTSDGLFVGAYEYVLFRMQTLHVCIF